MSIKTNEKIALAIIELNKSNNFPPESTLDAKLCYTYHCKESTIKLINTLTALVKATSIPLVPAPEISQRVYLARDEFQRSAIRLANQILETNSPESSITAFTEMLEESIKFVENPKNSANLIKKQNELHAIINPSEFRRNLRQHPKAEALSHFLQKAANFFFYLEIYSFGADIGYCAAIANYAVFTPFFITALAFAAASITCNIFANLYKPQSDLESTVIDFTKSTRQLSLAANPPNNQPTSTKSTHFTCRLFGKTDEVKAPAASVAHITVPTKA